MAASCETGFKDDDFLSVFPVPCNLHVPTHFALSVLWSVILAFWLVDLFLSRLFHKAPKLRGFGGQTSIDVGIVLWAGGSLALFLQVAANPYGSVNIYPGSVGLLIAAGTSMVGLVVYNSARSVTVSFPLMQKAGIGETHIEAKFFRVVRIAQYFCSVTYPVIVLITLDILPFTLTDDKARDTSIRIAAFGEGALFLIVALGFGSSLERVRRLLLKQLEFDDGNVEATPRKEELRLLAKRLRVSSSLIFGMGPAGSIAWILVGVTAIDLSWIFVHVLLGFVPSFALVVARPVARDSLFATTVCRSNFQANARSSSKSGSGKTSENNRTGKADGVHSSHTGRGSVMPSVNLDDTPSSMLQSINMSELTTPAAALISMRADDDAEDVG